MLKLQTLKIYIQNVELTGLVLVAGSSSPVAWAFHLWKAIERNYNAHKGPIYPIRTLRSLEGRWSNIKEQANKFESHYNNILNERRSGYSDMDKVRIL